ncbi:hypothetical protein E4U46_001954 [Claviceps purpurea]|nr:hypothetical protein E4U28_008199 [Claviceps purpurea]KAG6171850.1 hypothetical protein E4U51_008157 [Claviceps purpurea]KAG6191597.1 hypothetical protein E4U36_007173 [Claviceps purpurea]KAG6228378.1 hypothetical protein E4U26_001051 [Claviceps purpurea]KAG6290248.1 hypothetical protein E4U46_001954 [Claviceps purpurea]
MLDPFHDRETALPRIPKQSGGRGVMHTSEIEVDGKTWSISRSKANGVMRPPVARAPGITGIRNSQLRTPGKAGKDIYMSGKAGKAGKNIRPTEVHLRSELSISNPFPKGSPSYYTLMSILAMDRHPTVYRLQVLTVAPKA